MKPEADVDEELLPTTPTSRKQNLDIADIIGGYGFWQRRIFLIILFLHIPCAFNVYSMSFLAPNIDHWCARPAEATNMSVSQWRMLAMPSDDQHCSRYEYINFTLSLQNNTNISGKTVIPCKHWEYDTTFYRSTLLNKFNLVCDRKWLVSLSKSIFISGMSLSLIIFGHLSDRIGRKPVIIISAFLTVLFSILAAFSTTFAMFLVARFFIALGVTVFFNTPFVLLMEIVAPKYRSRYGVGVQIGWSLGMSALPLIAWLIRNSFWIQIAITSPCLMLLAIQWIPESPRWLLNHGREDEAEEILFTAAEINGVKYSDADKKELKKLITQLAETYKFEQSNGSILDVMKTPGLRKIALNVYFNWFVISFIYYGLSINTNEMAGDPFVNFAMAGIVEIPAYLLTIFIVELQGKKKLLIVTIMISGVACFLSYLLPLNPWWLTTTVSSIGKLSITAAFGIIYLYTNELFPTVVRNTGMGIASLCGRLGSLTAPFMRELGSATHPIFPYIIFGALAVVSGFLVLLFPETTNISLPNTLEEAAQFYRNKNCRFFADDRQNCTRMKKAESAETNNERDIANLFYVKCTTSV